MTHHLKCWPEMYKLVQSGNKNFEYRKDDRGFKVGDTLELHEWNPDAGEYTGSFKTFTVTCIVRPHDIPYQRWNMLPLPPGHCIMGISPSERIK